MSYTPENEVLDEPVESLLNALEEVRDAAMSRLKAGGYQEAHMERCKSIVQKLTALEIDLVELVR